MNRSFGSLALLAALLCAACVSSLPGGGASLPSPAPFPETVPETSTRPIRTSSSWKISPTSQTLAYSTLLTTVIVEAGGLPPRQDSLITRAFYSIEMTGGADSLSFSGSVTSLSVEGPSYQTPEVLPTFPIFFTGKVSKHNIYTQRSDNSLASSCTDVNQASLRIVQRNLFLLPLEIEEGQKWTDSTSSIVCNGMLPLTHTSIRTFHVLGEAEFNGSQSLIVDQNERTFSKGEGSQGQHRIFVDTQGETSGRLYIDRTSGQLLAANLTSRVSLSIKSSGRVQHFIQNSTETTQQTR